VEFEIEPGYRVERGDLLVDFVAALPQDVTVKRS